MLENGGEVRNPTYQTKDIESSILSEAYQSPFKTSEQSEQYNLFSDQSKAQNQPNFVTSEDNKVVDVWQSPGKISEEEKIQIIQRGFQLQAQETISLKKYYESTDEASLFQLKGYSIKYESIRRTSLYKSLKE